MCLFIPWGVEQEPIVQEPHSARPSQGGSPPNATPLVAPATLLNQQSGWSVLVRSESYGEWPAQHAEDPVQQNYLYSF